jgi:hypothetical protein
MCINSLRKKTSILLSLALLLAVSAFAQTSASLSGTVHDPQGGAVAGAKVTLKDTRLGAHLEAGDNARKLQLRLEMFNAFNHAQFSDMNRNVTWSSFNAYLAERQAGSASILNVRKGSQGATSRIGDGVGEVNGLHNAVSPNRIIQLAVKGFF